MFSIAPAVRSPLFLTMGNHPLNVLNKKLVCGTYNLCILHGVYNSVFVFAHHYACPKLNLYHICNRIVFFSMPMSFSCSTFSMSHITVSELVEDTSTRDMKSIWNSLFFLSNKLIKIPSISFLAVVDVSSASSTISADNLSLVCSHKYLSMQVIKESQVLCDIYDVLLGQLSRYCLIIGSSSS